MPINPLRRRVQLAVDRRFHRSHYDAERLLAESGRRMQSISELDRLAEDLVATAGDAFEPERASVWLRTTAD